MNPRRSALAALGLSALLAAPASAQVAFQPVVNAFPNGVGLSATPVVSADRRYVRLGMNPTFTGLEGFDTYSVPAAVGGGGVGAGGVGGFRSVGGNFGMNGQVGPSPGGYGDTTDPDATAFLAGGAGYAERPRLAAGLAQAPKPKVTRAKRNRPAQQPALIRVGRVAKPLWS